MRLAGIVFQACSFNHSDISPFRINSLQRLSDLNYSDCDKSSNVQRSLTGFPSIAVAVSAVAMAHSNPVVDPVAYFYHEGHRSTAVHRIGGKKLLEGIAARPRQRRGEIFLRTNLWRSATSSGTRTIGTGDAST